MEGEIGDWMPEQNGRGRSHGKSGSVLLTVVEILHRYNTHACVYMQVLQH